MIGPVIRNAVRDLVERRQIAGTARDTVPVAAPSPTVAEGPTVGDGRHFVALHLSCGHAERRPATCERMARLYCWHPDCERTRVVLHVERVP